MIYPLTTYPLRTLLTMMQWILIFTWMMVMTIKNYCQDNEDPSWATEEVDEVYTKTGDDDIEVSKPRFVLFDAL